VREVTALLSVATPDMTNIRRNVIMNSNTKACRLVPFGSVPENWSCFPINNSFRVPLASVLPRS